MIFREGLARILEEVEGIELVASCPNARDTINKVIELKPDILLLNQDVPGIDPLKLVHHVKELHPEIRIIFLTPPQPPPTGQRISPLDILRSGVSGVVSAEASESSLIDSIIRVYDGITVLPSQMGGAALEELSLTSEREEARKQTNLSAREKEVLGLVAGGLTNKEISEALFITEFTVKVHLTSIFKKLGAKNRLQAAVTATQMKLIPKAPSSSGYPGSESSLF